MPGLPEIEEGRDWKGEEEGPAEVVGDALGSAGGDWAGEEDGVVAEEVSEEAMGYFCL